MTRAVSKTDVMKNQISIVLLSIATASATACASAQAVQHPEAPPPSSPVAEPTEIGAAELAAYSQAKPVFEAHCASCHATRSSSSNAEALEHFNMDAYPFGGHHATGIGSAIREVLGASGAKPTMPRDKPGAVQGSELQLVLAWADAFDRAHPENSAAHGHDDNDHDEPGDDGHEHEHQH
ncbi:MAG TPA: hypothetical protein VJU61_07180 [Polyangiaceae bacterium]|nr:hypothetical protein [Polyangiaceae bacterium]